jgi:TolB-like protein
MKKQWILFLLFVCAVCSFAQEQTGTLDRAIKNSMMYFAERLPEGGNLVVLNFGAPTTKLSDYIIEELTISIVNDGRLTVVDRRNLYLLQEEMDFQMSGEVSDETAQTIGQKLGAQIIVSGSIVPLGNRHRMRVQAIEVETARILGAQTYTILTDQTLASLLDIPYVRPVFSSESNNGQDFTLGRGIGYGFLNLGFGLGSFLMHDWKGGATLAAGYGVGLSLIIIEVAALKYEDNLAGVPGAIGIGITGITAVYGFVRPFLYQRNIMKNGPDNVLNGINVTVIPDNNGIKAFNLTWTGHF